MDLRTCAFLVALGACGGAQAPSPQTPVAPVVTAPAPRLDVALGGARWTVAVRDATVAAAGDEATVTAPGFTLRLLTWPKSDAFFRTATEHLAGLRGRDPGLAVVLEVDHGPGDWQVVAQTAGKLDGAVLVPGGGDDAMCTFELAEGGDWRAAVDACLTLTESMAQGVEAYGQELP